LYTTFVDWCKSKNVGKLRVEASAQNEWAIKFYRKNNFKDYTLVLETEL
jgi:ribosomal protein S18 acetylase RimI-like enzyme